MVSRAYRLLRCAPPAAAYLVAPSLASMLRRGMVALCCVLASLPARAIDYLSVAEPAIMYDAPSAKSRPMFVVARGTPVESVVVVGAWVKVRDAKGDLAWIEKSQLASDRRTVIVRARLAQIHAEAADSTPVVFEAEADVVLEFLAMAAPGWVQVRHADGQTGFVKLNQIWGA